MEAPEQHHEADAAHAPAEVGLLPACLLPGASEACLVLQLSSFAVRPNPPSWPSQVLPLNRIKRLMKEEADVKAVSAEASYAAARATVRPPFIWGNFCSASC
jgi:hypothetical protein